MSPPRAGSRFARALAGAPDAPVAVGLTFAPPEVLLALGGSREPVEALPGACEKLDLDFVFVPPGSEAAMPVVAERACEPIAEVAAPLGRVLHQLGWTDGLRATAEDPSSLRPALDEAEKSAAEAVRVAAAAGAGAVVLAEDLTGSSGPLVPPDFAFAEVFPRLQRLAEAAAAGGLPALLHTDGDARAFVSSAARAGFAGVHGGGGLEPEGVASLVAAVRRARLSFVGGIPTVELASGPMRAVAAGSRVGLIARAGGVLLADDGGMSSAAEASSFVSALQAAREAAGRGDA
ncbi:MAG: hypothetical protein IBX62_02060 [Coriobacteriia bacterium]|nr:hypothetical protein [Coriobacteriia bacterium]